MTMTPAAGRMAAAHRLAAALAVVLLTMLSGASAASADPRTGGAVFADTPATATFGARAGRPVLSPDALTAIAPADAPPAVKAAIAAANRIVGKPYRYGGGHGRWRDTGYDCSGTVSYALRGGRLIGTPLPSGSLMSWGLRGRGRWITVYAHGGHTYAVIAGLRLDTSGPGERGPRWRPQARSSRGFVARHPAGY